MDTQSHTLKPSSLTLALALLGLVPAVLPHAARAAPATEAGAGAQAQPASTHPKAAAQPHGAAIKGRATTAHDRPAAARVPRRQLGKASIYARMFNHRTMADGHRMDPAAPNAASKTLPLGTVAQVTNLETGRSTQVTIQDRGPYVKGRVVDLSPASAAEIGLDLKQGVVPVEVKPVAVPGPDGSLEPVNRDG